MNKMSRKKRSFFYLLIISIAYILTNLHRSSLAVLAPFLEESMDLDLGQIGLLGSILFYIYGLVQLPLGLLTDRFGAKIIIRISAFVLLVGSLVFGLASDFPQLLLGRCLIALSISGFYIPSMELIRQWFDLKFYGFYLGVFLSLGYLGSLISSIPLDFFLQSLGIRPVYFFLSFLALLTGLGSFIIEEDGPRSGHKKNGPGFGRDFLVLLLGISIFSLVFNGARQAFQSVWANIYYIQVFGLSSLAASSMLMVYNLGAIIFPPFVGRLADRRGNYQTLLMITLVLSGFWILFGLSPQSSPIWLLVLLALVLGALNSTGMQNAFTLVGEYATEDIRSSAAAIINSVSYFGSAIFSQVMGRAFSGLEMTQGLFIRVFVIFSVLLLASLVPLVLAKRYIDLSRSKKTGA